MYTIVRSYFGKGSKELFDVVEKNKADVEKLMRSVKGFVSYAIVRTGDGGFTVTVCNDKAGADESVEKARDWIAKNAAGTGVAPPTISEGPNILDLKNGPLNPALVSPMRRASGPPRAISSGSFPHLRHPRSAAPRNAGIDACEPSCTRPREGTEFASA
jgi:hypothetical protein